MEKYNKGEFTPGGFGVPVCDRIMGTELSSDFILPDYQPEIRRLLKIGVTVTPPARYIGSGNAEFSGNVCYDVLYAGGDGQLYSAHLTAPYGFETQLDETDSADLSGGVCALADIQPDSVTGRVMAPRKIGIRCRLKAHIRCYADCEINERITGLDSQASLRRLTDTAESAVIVRCSEESVPMGDEVIPELREGEIRIISSDGRVFVNEASAANGCVVCRGELVLKILLCREGGDGEVEVVTRRLPFTRELAAESVTPGWECRAWGCCPEVSVTVGDGRLNCEASMALEAEAQKKGSFDYTKDIYSVAAQSEGVFADRQITLPVRCMNGNFTQSGVFDAAENQIPAGARVIDADGDASAEAITCEKGRCVVTGEVKYSILYNDGGEYGCRELVQPFRYETDIPGGTYADGALSGSAELCVTGCRARMDGERISVDSEICAALRACDGGEVKVLEEARFIPGVAGRRGECVVCYPDSSDTLWSVAKRYGADADRIAAQNSVRIQGAPDRADTLAGVKFLIV